MSRHSSKWQALLLRYKNDRNLWGSPQDQACNQMTFEDSTSEIMCTPLKSFPLFISFPLEIQSLILQVCPPNDRICLSLAKWVTAMKRYAVINNSLTLDSKELHALASAKQRVSLSNSDEEVLCGSTSPGAGETIYYWRNKHRRECHRLCWKESNRRLEANGLASRPLKKCRTNRFGSDHCDCFSQKYRLYNRLRSWTPKALKFCGHCDKFTRRKRQHNGRCEHLPPWSGMSITNHLIMLGYHGYGKPRTYQGNYWTYNARRGGFGRKLWRKWFTNRAMQRLENRLENGLTERDRGTRYSLREIKARESWCKNQYRERSSPCSSCKGSSNIWKRLLIFVLLDA